jgi:Uma2 family endonuclease
MPATTEFPIPEKERYTYDDYQQLPEGAPYELIQGQLVMPPAPSVQHQRIVAAEHADRVGTQEIGGAPDIVMEVVPPTSSHHDLLLKKELYERHGVPEYWIVDPESRTVEVFRNTDDGFAQHARVGEAGAATSALLEDFMVDLDGLFQT